MDSFPFEIIRSDDAKKPTVIFIAGFPDNQLSALHPSIPEAIAKEYNMVCLCLPGYEKGCKTIRPWGYDMDELISMLHRSITVHGKAGQPVYLMAHDWGAYLSLIFVNKYPETASKLILLDIGIASFSALKTHEVIIIITYQIWFAISYILSQTVSYVIGSILFLCFFLPIFKPLWPAVGEKPSVPRREVTVEKCYPYYYFWKNIYNNRRDMLSPKFPKCPVLFLYGTKKNCKFHTDEFLSKLDQTEGCKHFSIEGGHWFAKTSPEIVIKEAMDFFAKPTITTK